MCILYQQHMSVQSSLSWDLHIGWTEHSQSTLYPTSASTPSLLKDCFVQFLLCFVFFPLGKSCWPFIKLVFPEWWSRHPSTRAWLPLMSLCLDPIQSVLCLCLMLQRGLPSTTKKSMIDPDAGSYLMPRAMCSWIPKPTFPTSEKLFSIIHTPTPSDLQILFCLGSTDCTEQQSFHFSRCTGPNRASSLGKCRSLACDPLQHLGCPGRSPFSPTQMLIQSWLIWSSHMGFQNPRLDPVPQWRTEAAEEVLIQAARVEQSDDITSVVHNLRWFSLWE